MKPRDAYYFRRRRLIRILFWTAVALAIVALMDYVTPEACESAATFTEICI